MSSRNDKDSTPNPPPEDTDPKTGYDKTVPPDSPDRSRGRGSSYGYGVPARSYIELHGDVHKGQEPPEEKD